MDKILEEKMAVAIDELLTPEMLSGQGALTQQVYALVSHLIVTLQLVPNRPLSEIEVATSLNLSKTPVREAFINLAESGLVSVVPKSGTYVAPISLDRAFEGYFIRRALETECVQQVARARSHEDLFRLKAQITQQRKALKEERFTDFHRLDNEFHDLLFSIANVPTARRFVSLAKLEVDRIRNLKLQMNIRRVQGVLEEHAAVVEAIDARDTEAARLAMGTHIDSVKTAIETLATDSSFWDLLHTVNRDIPRKRRPRST